MQNWYVIQCKPKREQTAIIHLKNQDYIVYCPVIRAAGGCESLRGFELLFPSYLFISHGSDIINVASINATRGVRKIVCFGGMLASVSDVDIEEIRRRMDTINAQVSVAPGVGAQLSLKKSASRMLADANLAAMPGEQRLYALLGYLESKARTRPGRLGGVGLSGPGR